MSVSHGTALTHVGTVTVAATTDPFVVCDHFVVNTNKDAPINISYLGKNFREWFNGKTETPFSGSTLSYSKLSHYSLDDPIIKELGGEEKAETTLTELFSLMRAQKNGEDGPLLTNGHSNIFYVRDINGVLRKVIPYWLGAGWHVCTSQAARLNEWRDQLLVFSRDS